MTHPAKIQNHPTQSDADVQSVSQVLDVLETFLSHESPIGLSDLAMLLQMEKNTAQRLLDTLEARGYVYRSTARGKYRLGARLFELGGRFQNQLDIRRAALPELTSLVEQTEQAAFLCVRDRDDALCVERVEGRHRARIYALNVGAHQPLHCGAAPRALLCEMTDAELLAYASRTGLPTFTPATISTPQQLLEDVHLTRSQGYAVSNQDVSPGIGAIGSPVRDFTKQVVASISVSGIAASYTQELISSLGGAVQAAAERISDQLGFASR